MSALTEDLLNPVQEQEVSNKRKRGRPRGSGKKLPEFRNWQPKSWKMEYDIIIFLHCQGKSHREIAKLQDYGEVQVGNIINCKLGQEAIDKIRRNVIGGGSLEEKYKYILEKSTDRVLQTLNNDDVAKSSPIMTAQLSLRAMEMIDKNLKASGVINNNTIILATEEAVSRFNRGLAKAEEARKINAGAAQPLPIADRIGVVEANNG